MYAVMRDGMFWTGRLLGDYGTEWADNPSRLFSREEDAAGLLHYANSLAAAADTRGRRTVYISFEEPARVVEVDIICRPD